MKNFFLILNFRKIIKNILSLNQNLRRLILLFLDALIIFFTFSFSIYLTEDSLSFYNYYFHNIFILINIVVLISIFFFTGTYKGLTRYAGSKYFYDIILRNFIGLLFLKLVLFASKITIFNFKFFITYYVLLSCGIISSRIFLRDLLNKNISKPNKQKKKVAIYGAGKDGVQLSIALRISGKYEIVTFIDDSKDLWSRSINGIPINSSDIVIKNQIIIDQVHLAIANITRKKSKEIYSKFANKGIPIFQLPTIEKINSEEKLLSSLKKIEIEDLLGREPAKANDKLLRESVEKKVILITGAGGSIGSELCREVIKLNPKKLILFERSESLLYEIEKELKIAKIEITSVLGSITDEELFKSTLNENKVNIILHTAAYKHVPLVESNPLQGIYNNVIGTKIICKSSNLASIEKVLLISSDKAVRPTNVMGATKRLSELIIKYYSNKSIDKINGSRRPIFSMVRFGNVLGSSGSVVPLFKEQIQRGGPITLTSKKIIRYFMTINEASQLVLQAASLAKSGDLLLLDMGSPMKIFDLAKQMINLSGLSIKDKKNKNGDIEIQVTGLRKGEKLFEELLIDNKSEKTLHPLIFKAKEKTNISDDFENDLNSLEYNLRRYDKKLVFSLLKKLVPEWEMMKNNIDN